MGSNMVYPAEQERMSQVIVDSKEKKYDIKIDNEHLIDKGGFAYVFKTTRKIDGKVFAIKVSKDKLEDMGL